MISKMNYSVIFKKHHVFPICKLYPDWEIVSPLKDWSKLLGNW